LPTDAIYAYGLSDPVYPLENYEDLAAAVNKALADMGQQSVGGTVFLPPIGDARIGSGKISIPPIGKFSQPAIVGPNHQAMATELTLKPRESFPDDTLIEHRSPSAGDGAGITLRGIFVADPNSVISNEFIKLVNNGRNVLSSISIWQNPTRDGGADRLVDITETEGETQDFAYLTDLNLGWKSPGYGMTGLRCSAGQVWMNHCNVGGGGTLHNHGAGDTAIQFTGATGALVSAYLKYVDRGIHLVDHRETVDPGAGRGNWIAIRAERPGAEVRHPVYNEGWHGVSILPLNAPERQYRTSVDLGYNTEWLSGAVHSHPQANIAGGGRVPSKVRTVGDVTTGPGTIRLRGSGDTSARIDNWGTPLLTPRREAADTGGLSALKPKLQAQIDPATAAGAVTRVGLVDERWSDWVGVVYDARVDSYRLRAVQNGRTVVDREAGFGPSGIGDMVTVSYGPPTIDTPGSLDERVSIDGGAMLSASVLASSGSPQRTAFMTATNESQFDGVETVYALEAPSGTDAMAELYQGRLVYGNTYPG
jgi:hypothetical protein